MTTTRNNSRPVSKSTSKRTFQRFVRIGAILCGIWPACLPAQNSTGKPDELTISKVTRLTPPQVSGNITEFFYSVHYPYSSDGKRIAYFEDLVGSLSMTPYRGMVWGNIDDLKKWKTLDEYLKVTHPIAIPVWNGQYSAHLEWSPFKGQENIIFALVTGEALPALRTKPTLVAYNTDTKSMTDVVSVDAPTSDPKYGPQIMGWTKDLHLVVHVQGDQGQPNQAFWKAGAWEIDVQNKTKRLVANAFGAMVDWADRWPRTGNHGHGAGSPDWTMWFSGCQPNSIISSRLHPWSCDSEADNSKAVIIRKLPGHFFPDKRAIWYNSWTASNSWWIASDPGVAFTWNNPHVPYIDNFVLAQIWTDGTAKLLYTHRSAGYAWGPNAENWGHLLMPLLKKDGKQILFTSTDNVFSIEDHGAKGVAPTGFSGVFLAELKTADGTTADTLPPAVPTNLAATSSNGTVKLTWNPPADNVGVAGYHVFRDGFKIALVRDGTTQYVDTYNLPAGRDCEYTISAYDFMANESERTAKVTVTVSTPNRAATNTDP